MATIFGGQRILNLLQFTDDSQGDANPTYNYYQVPAGRWSEVTIHQARFGSGFHNGAILLMGIIPFNNEGGGNLSLYGDTPSIFEEFNSTGNATVDTAMRGDATFLLTSGQTISKTLSSGSPGTGIAIWATVKEFANP